MEVEIKKTGHNKIEIGTKKGKFGSIVLWFESPNNSLVESDIKSELSAIALAEIIREHLQVYVDIHSKGEPN